MSKYDAAGVSIAKVPVSPIDQVNDALRLAREIADRSTYLAGRLCGHPPQPALAGSTSGEKPSNGLFYDLAENASETRKRVLDALEELNRLESTLPRNPSRWLPHQGVQEAARRRARMEGRANG